MLMSLVEKDENKGLYFHAWGCLCSFYMRTHQYEACLKEIFQFQATDLKLQRLFCRSKFLLANVYEHQLRNRSAIDQYLNTAKMGMRIGDYVVVDECYRLAAAMFIRLEQYAAAQTLLNRDLKVINKYPGNWARSKAMNDGLKGICYYYARDYGKMREMFDHIKDHKPNELGLQRWIYYRLKVHCYISQS